MKNNVKSGSRVKGSIKNKMMTDSQAIHVYTVNSICVARKFSQLPLGRIKCI